MVQFFPQTPAMGTAGQIGQALGMGLGIPAQIGMEEFRYQRGKGRLSQAFNELQRVAGEDYLTQLGKIAPALLSTPGGAEALGELAPILAKRSQNQAIQKSIEERKLKRKPGEPAHKVLADQNQKQLIQGAEQEQQLPESDVDTEIGRPKGREPVDAYRRRPQPTNEESVYPQITAGPQVQKVLSPYELEDYAMDLMQSSSLTGQPLTFDQAMNVAERQNNQIKENNQQILKEQQLRDQKNKEMFSGVVNRAINSGEIDPNSPEEQTVAEKLAYLYRNEPNPAEQWEKVRTGLRDFKTSKNQILREASMPGPFQRIGRMLMGTYKDKEAVQKSLQKPLQIYKDLGLIDEARDLLSGELGMGAEDVENTIFPMSESQTKELYSFPVNKTAVGEEDVFPGSKFNLPTEKFDVFKNQLADFFQKNPGINLIGTRGILNQKMRYSWEDYSKALNELIEEKRFRPDLIQSQQLPIVNQAPLPGLTQQFKFWWERTK